MAQFMFAPSMGIETGLYYSSLGSKEKIDYSGNITEGPVTTGVNIDAKSTVSASYIQLPVSFLYKFNVGPGLSLYPSIGLYMGLGVGGNVKESGSIEFPDYPTFNKYIDSKVDLFGKGDKDGDGNYTGYEANRFDAGLTFGLNLEYNKIVLGVGYDLGLTKLNNESDSGVDDMHNRNLKVSVGYFF